MKLKPITFIDTLRNSDEYIKYIYTEGGCYQFYLLLKLLYPKAIPYISIDRQHVITRIDNKFYDIRGEFRKYLNYKPMTDADIEMAKDWNFRKQNLLKLTECEYCGEPICI